MLARRTAVTENEKNRRWLLANRIAEPTPGARPTEEAETLLYYQTQLEAELSYVRRQLKALGLGAMSSV
jgi:hypothetical protein